MPTNQFPLLLRQERERRGWSQKYVADALKVTRVTVTRWELGTASPSLYFRGSLCKLFEKHIEEFFPVDVVDPLMIRLTPKRTMVKTENNPADRVTDDRVLHDNQMLTDREIQQLYRLELQEKHLEIQRKRIEYTIEIAAQMMSVLDPVCDAALRSLAIEELLIALQQAPEENGSEIPLPTFQSVRKALEAVKLAKAQTEPFQGIPYTASQEDVTRAHQENLSLLKNHSLPFNSQIRNPYGRLTPVLNPQEFFGRQEELRTLYNAIDKRQCISIVGSTHIGKSSLLKFLGEPEVQQHYGYDLDDRIFILIDWREYQQKTREDFFHTVCEQIISQSFVPLRPSSLHGEERFKKLLEEMKNAGFRPVLLMDVFDKVTNNQDFGPDFFSFLRALAGIYDLISYVTASVKPLYDVCHSDAVASSPFFNIFQTCTLGPLTLQEGRDLITVPAQRAGCAFTADEVDWMVTQAGRHPFFLQVACRHFFEEKLRQGHGKVDRQHVQQSIYEELLPHFDYAWDGLTEEQKRVMKLEASQPAKSSGRKMPELSESWLFRKRVRELSPADAPTITLKDVKEALENLDNTDFLDHCQLSEAHYILLKSTMSPPTKRGVLVREFLNEAFERMQGPGVRRDAAPEWILYNVLYYRYFKLHLQNEQIAARLQFSSIRQYYRERTKAIEVLLQILLEMEESSNQAE